MSYSFRPGVQHALLIVHSRVHVHHFVIYRHVFLVVLFSLTQVYVSSLSMNELKMPSSYTSAFYPAIKLASSEHPLCTLAKRRLYCFFLDILNLLFSQR